VQGERHGPDRKTPGGVECAVCAKVGTAAKHKTEIPQGVVVNSEREAIDVTI